MSLSSSRFRFARLLGILVIVALAGLAALSQIEPAAPVRSIETTVSHDTLFTTQN